MEKNKIELKWIEKGTKDSKKKISIAARLDEKELKIISVKCFPAIICLTCGPAFNHPCPQLA